MIIIYHRLFDKQRSKLPFQLRKKIQIVVQIFQDNPHSPQLRNHALVGKMLGKRAIRVTDDVRIVYETEDDHLVVLFLKVGTHSQVYE